MTLHELAEQINLDLEQTLKLFMGKEELYSRLLKKYPDNAEKILADLAVAVQNSDNAGIEAGAHTLKGVSANLGMVTVSELSAALTQDVRESTYERIPQDYEMLLKETRKAIEAIALLR